MSADLIFLAVSLIFPLSGVKTTNAAELSIIASGGLDTTI
jgi:hypothetical protein